MTKARDALTLTSVPRERRVVALIRSARTRRVDTFAVVHQASCSLLTAVAKTWTSASSLETPCALRMPVVSTQSVLIPVTARMDSGNCQAQRRPAMTWTSVRSNRESAISGALTFSGPSAAPVRLDTNCPLTIVLATTLTSVRSTSHTISAWVDARTQWARTSARVPQDIVWDWTAERARILMSAQRSVLAGVTTRSA